MNAAERRTSDPGLAARLQKSLSYCWKEGVAAQVMISIFDYYLIPYALFLGASTQHVGFLIAIPNVLASLSQLFAVTAVRAAGNRLRLIVSGMILQTMFLLPLCVLPFYPKVGTIPLLIVLTAIFRVLGSIMGPAWGSLVSEYLPDHRRGEYFGWRARVVGVSGIVAVAFWGMILHTAKTFSPAVAFGLLFLGAAAARACSAFLMSRMVELPLHRTQQSDFTFWMFIRRFRESNFVRFVLFVATVTFATNLAAPYFSVFMLKELGFSYLTYTAVHLGAVATGLLSFPLWGRHADHVGNARVLKVSSLLIPIIPFLWIPTQNVAWLIAVEMFAGFAWGGFNLCATNFIYDAVSPDKRVRCLGYFNLINGVAVFLGASLGGMLAEHLPALQGSRLQTLFVLSGAGRLAAHFLLSGGFKEVRAAAQPVSSGKLFFSVVGLRPLIGRNNEWNPMPTFSGKRNLRY